MATFNFQLGELPPEAKKVREEIRDFPIFRAWVSTWRYRESRAATPTVRRSATYASFRSVCNTGGCCSKSYDASACATAFRSPSG